MSHSIPVRGGKPEQYEDYDPETRSWVPIRRPKDAVPRKVKKPYRKPSK